MTTLVLTALALCAFSHTEFTPLVDFRTGAHGWRGNAFVEDLRETPEGIAFRTTGRDPWLESPPLDGLPQTVRIELRLRMRSTADRLGELFFGSAFSPKNTVAFSVINDGAWHDYTLLLPPLPPGARLRIDPATSAGEITIASIEVRELPPPIETELAKAVPFMIPPVSAARNAGLLRVEVHPQRFNAFAVLVDGVEMARSHAAARIGYLHDDAPHYLDFAGATMGIEDTPGGALTLHAEQDDIGGARWKWTLVFRAAADGALEVESRVSVSEPRRAFHLPMVTLLPGHGAFGERKAQALLPGVEYLEDEPSSSEADLRGEQAVRRMVADYRINYPMMALAHEGRYIGLLWNRAEGPQAVFDSPDTLLDSGAHLFGLWLPAAGEARHENDLAIQRPIASEDGAFPTVRATLIGGYGDTIVPAVHHFVRLRGLPALPVLDGGFDHAVTLLAHGWLDSGLHEDGHWRHAVWHDQFRAQPAADGVDFMHWLQLHARDAELRERLAAAIARGIERLPEDNPAGPGIGHVRRHTPALTRGPLDSYIEARLASARATLAQFDADGVRRYQAHPERPDYGATHFADHANGLAATPLSEVLETAALTGDPDLTAEAIALLDKLTALYAGTVPRGAQTWEIPLHTPDILASARLVQCYVLGHLLTGREDLLDQARYWAWTGLAFVYLDNPTPGEVGPYATIAVLGATNWVAPNWIGLPVQWCGLVYRSSLVELALVDPDNAAFWEQIAHGITLSGMQQTFPLSDQRQQGLLPDFFHLEAQISDGPAINPGTVQFHLGEVYGKTPFFQRRRLVHTGAIVSAPGALIIEQDEADGIAVSVAPWVDTAFRVVIAHLPGQWRISGWTGSDGIPSAEHQAWETPARTSRLVIELDGPGTLALTRAQAP